MERRRGNGKTTTDRKREYNLAGRVVSSSDQKCPSSTESCRRPRKAVARCCQCCCCCCRAAAAAAAATEEGTIFRRRERGKRNSLQLTLNGTENGGIEKVVGESGISCANMRSVLPGKSFLEKPKTALSKWYNTRFKRKLYGLPSEEKGGGSGLVG